MKIFALAICLLLLAPSVWAASQARDVELGWSANKEADLGGYKLYQCDSPAPPLIPVCTKADSDVVTDVGLLAPVAGKVAFIVVGPVDEGTAFVVSAYDTAGNESPESNQVEIRIPPKKPEDFVIKKFTAIIEFVGL